MDTQTVDTLNKLLTIAFPASILTAILASIFNKFTNDKNQSLKYITEERAKWREFVRDSVSKICASNYGEESRKAVITRLKLSLNPLDGKRNFLDVNILDILNKILDYKSTPDDLKELSYLVGLLLKYDWERSKNETKSILKRWYHNFKLNVKFRVLRKRINAPRKTVSDENLDACEKMNEYELWETVRKIADQGMKKTR
ncbi:hypothetical protein H6F38_14345 [Paenibacillus sp. EKM208P]|nr:hypothetical protein H6F38_14345 [Paenibacillus sp. EKM208P]